MTMQTIQTTPPSVPRAVDPREVVSCPLGPERICDREERIHRAVKSQVEASEMRNADRMAEGFAAVNKRFDQMGAAIGELRNDLREETTANHIQDERITHNEGLAARGSAVAETALAETAKLGARQGRRKGQMESAVVTLLGVLAYAVAKHYGLALP